MTPDELIHVDFVPIIKKLIEPVTENQLINNTGGTGSGGGELTGTIITTSATPGTALFASVGLGQTLFVYSKVSATGSDGKHGGFIRTATFKNVSGTVTLIDQIQDAYTVRNDARWEVDYDISGTGVLLQVTGVASVTITWSYSILFILI